MNKFIKNISIVPLLIMVGCSSNSNIGSGSSVKSTIKIAGSTSVAPLVKMIKNSYESENKDVSIEIQESGSTAGITATIQGVANLGMSSRNLSDEELAEGLVATAIAIDAIAVIVNPKNPVNNLTNEQITSIYKGEITNWKEVGGNDHEIIVVSREEGSGTRGAYEELMNLEKTVERNGEKLKSVLVTNEAIFESGEGAVKYSVLSSKNAIGYISLGIVDDTVKTLEVNGVKCTEENVKNNLYFISRPFLVMTLGDGSDNVNDFIKYLLSEHGQKIASEHSYIPIN
jgi:phosphate transport system substrate-binding protein